MNRATKKTRIRKVLDEEARHLDYAARDKLTQAWMALPLRDFEASISAGYLYPDDSPHIGTTPAGEVLKRNKDGEPVSVRTPGGLELHLAVVRGQRTWVTIPEDPRDEEAPPSASHWPPTLEHEGATYRRTGKTGTNVSTGQPSAEYEAATGLPHRVWLRADGTVRDE